MTASTLAPRLPIFAQRRRSRLLAAQPDTRLVELARQGSDGAFEVMVERYQPRLVVFCRNMVRSEEDARDLVQEVFANAHRAMLRDDRPIHLKAWLYKIARNRCLNHLRRPQPLAVEWIEEFEGASPSAHDAVTRRDGLQELVADVQELPETQRSALLLREMEGLSYEQIASVIDKTVPAVKSLLVRARVTLTERALAREPA